MIKDQLVEFAHGTRWLQEASDTGLHSPYGDDWDLLWLGHCTMKNWVDEDARYYVIDNDPTVPTPAHRLNSRRSPNLSPPGLDGGFSRVVYRPWKSTCTLSYALSLRGAQKVLLKYAISPVSTPAKRWDDSIEEFCVEGHLNSKCIGVYPALVESYKAAGNTSKDSDIVKVDATVREKAFVPNMVFPVRPNFDRFVTGQTVIPSQFGDESMLSEIDYTKYEMPRGKGLYITKDQFVVPSKS